MKNFKKGIIQIIPLLVIAVVISGLLTTGIVIFSKKQLETNLGATTLQVFQGGTGTTTFASGQCLKGAGAAAITTGACGGTGGSTDQLGQIGDVSTTTLVYGSMIRYNTGTSEWESVATSTLGFSGASYTAGTGVTLLGTVFYGSTSTMGSLFYTNYSGVWDKIATTSLGITTANTPELTNLYWTQGRFDTALLASTSLPALTAGKATALAADPADCAAGTAATAIAASGALTCSITPLISGGTLTSGYHCRYDGTGIDCDRLEDASGECAANSVCMGGHAHAGINEAYASGWNADTDTPEKDDIYDYLHVMDTDDDSLVNALDVDGLDVITEIAAALKDGSGDCASGLICLGDHTHSGYLLDTGDTGTGAFDFGGATSFEIPNGAAMFTNTTGQIAIDTTTGQLRYGITAATSTLIAFQPASFTYGTSTAWSGTTTIALGTAYQAETWSGVQCFTDAGTLAVVFNDGTNNMNFFTASSTVANSITLSTNNTFTAYEKRYVSIGAPATSPTMISCTIKKAINPD